MNVYSEAWNVDQLNGKTLMKGFHVMKNCQGHEVLQLMYWWEGSHSSYYDYFNGRDKQPFRHSLYCNLIVEGSIDSQAVGKAPTVFLQLEKIATLQLSLS